MFLVRPEDVNAVLAAAQPGPAIDALRYAKTVMIDPADAPTPARPSLTGGPIDALLYAADYAMGHLRELTEAAGSPWVEALSGQWRIAALRAAGHTQRASS